MLVETISLKLHKKKTYKEDYSKRLQQYFEKNSLYGEVKEFGPFLTVQVADSETFRTMPIMPFLNDIKELTGAGDANYRIDKDSMKVNVW